MDKLVQKALDRSVVQCEGMYKSLAATPGQYPYSVDGKGQLRTSDPWFWSGAFFPGTLWYLYEYTGQQRMGEMAETMSRGLESQKLNRNSHEIGYSIGCTFSNSLRILGDEHSRQTVLTAASSLASQFNPTVGCIRSWNHPFACRWEYPVIIDNVVSLKLLLDAWKLDGNREYYQMALSHADRTIQNHFRPDYSSCHVVSYDTLSGKPLLRETYQGQSDNSAWARGQAWGLYGFTMLYAETGLDRYLEQACGIADFLISHPRLPQDGIPYWDFDDPQIPNAPRDASAGAIMASAMVQLSTLAQGQRAERYKAMAERQIRTLCSDEYMAPAGENCNYILRHGVGFKPAGSEVDVPLCYADYYFVEALVRYRTLHGKDDSRNSQLAIKK